MKFAGGLLNARARLSASLVTLLRSVLLLAGLMLLPALSSGQTFVQVNNNTDLVNAAAVSVPYTAAETAGNMNVVVVGWNDTSSSVLSVTDDNNNTYVLAAANAGHGLSQAIYYARNIAVGLHNPPTVTVTFNQNAGLPDIRVLEYSGLGATATVDNWAGASGDSVLADSGTATTTGTGDLILGAGTTQSHFTSVGTNYTLRVITAPFGDIAQDMNGGQAAGTYSSTAPLVSNAWVMQMVGFSSTGIVFGSAPLLDPTTPIAPASGTDIGGTVVTINGTNFQPGALVLFGTPPNAIPGVNCVQSGGTAIVCKTPAATADVAMDVTVVNVDGQSNTTTGAYTFQFVTPTITSITPVTGPTNGGTAFTIVGTNFQVGAQVTIDGLSAGDIVVQDPLTITGTSPGLPVGVNDLTVNNAGATATKTGAFTYTLGTGPINYIQRGSTGSATPVATLSKAMPNPQTAANLNVVIVGWSDTVATVSSVTDTEGNTYTLALPAVNGTGVSQAIYYAKNIVGDTGSPNQVTVTFNQAAQAPDLRILEYSGVDTTSPLDAATGQSGVGTLADTGTCTTTAAVDLIVGAGTTDTHFTGPGSGFNLLDISSPNGSGSEHQITSAAGSCEATAPLTNGNWVMQAAAFKAAPAPAPDFTISAVAVTNTVAPGAAASYTVTVTPTNGFSSAVALTCASVSLPTGAICGFTPASVTPTGTPVTSTLSISTTALTPAATSTVTITGTFGSVSHSTTVSLTVTGAPDFTIVAAPASRTVVAGNAAAYTITVNPTNSFSSAVALTCASVSLPAGATCVFTPTPVTPSGAAVTSGLSIATTAATPAGTSTVTVTGTFGSVIHSTTVSLTVTAAAAADFTLAGTALTPASVAAGASSTSTITVAALNGFNGTVNLTCGITPVVTRPATCAFSTAAVTNGAGTSTLTVSTTAATTASVTPQSRGIMFAMLLPIGGLALLGTGLTSSKKKLFGFLLGCVLFSGLIFLSACGGSSSSGGGGTGHPGTPAGTYTVTVTGTGPSGTPVHTTTLTLAVQ